VAEEDIPEASVSSPFGIIQFIVMPFCLMNTTQTFQRFMDAIFRDLDFVYCCIDNIIVMSEFPEQHRENLRVVLPPLQQYLLSINISNCCFGQSEVKYLGYTVNKDGCKPPTERVATIMNYNE
jgi:hypothetical protein